MKCQTRIGVVIVLFCTVDAQAKDFGEHGGYEVTAVEGTSETGKGICVMAEDDFEGPGGTRLRIFRSTDQPNLVFATIDNFNWTTKNGETYSVTYHFDQGSYERDASGIVDSIYHGLMTGFPADEFLKTFATSGRLWVYMGDTIVDKLSLKGSAAGKAAFDRCWIYIQADERAKERERNRWAGIPKNPFAVDKIGSRLARPAGNPESWVSSTDYPSSALRAGATGRVIANLAIGSDGRVTSCTVTSSSGNTALDDATCRLLKSRARYEPAISESGTPAAGADTRTVNWSLPNG